MSVLTIDTYYRVKDAKGDISMVVIPIPAATTLANAEQFVHDMADLIDDIVNGVIDSAGFSINVDISADTVGKVMNTMADVQEKAQFAWKTANGFVKKLGIPCFSENQYVPSSALVDLSDTDVAAFNTAMTIGIPLVAAPCDTRGEDLTTIDSAVEAWGKSRG